MLESISVTFGRRYTCFDEVNYISLQENNSKNSLKRCTYFSPYRMKSSWMNEIGRGEGVWYGFLWHDNEGILKGFKGLYFRSHPESTIWWSPKNSWKSSWPWIFLDDSLSLSLSLRNAMIQKRMMILRSGLGSILLKLSRLAISNQFVILFRKPKPFLIIWVRIQRNSSKKVIFLVLAFITFILPEKSFEWNEILKRKFFHFLFAKILKRFVFGLPLEKSLSPRFSQFYECVILCNVKFVFAEPILKSS